MRSILGIALALISTQSYAYDLQVLQPKHIYVEGYQYQDMHDPYIAPIDQDLKYGGAFGTDLYLIQWDKHAGLYWNNELGFDQDQTNGHIKHVGWHYELGLDLLSDEEGNSKIQLFKEHWSRHVVEEVRPEHFPVYDRIGVRFNIYP